MSKETKRKATSTTSSFTVSTKKQKLDPGRASSPAARSAKKQQNGESINGGRQNREADASKGKENGRLTKQDSSVKSSRETHAKQRALAQERKAAKPNAESIKRAKKLWERLRRKSHVAKEERNDLVAELFDIITGNVKEFVFKHDSVRVIQCAIKYATPEQKKAIARELQGDFRALAESRYAKFLIAKLLVTDDEEIRVMILGEFRGHVKRLINHPEASWILDDSYRQIARKAEREALLREWYGPEFAVFASKGKEGKEAAADGADLSKLLERNPEKRRPIMEHLFGMINQLVQKKMGGFTMLHDAMLQYSLAVGEQSSSQAAGEFMTLLTDTSDDEGDLLKNLAFTKAGSRVVCRALALGTAKDRKGILKVFKEHIETLAYDQNGMHVLLAAYEVVDDTVMTSKLIFPELLAAKQPELETRIDAIVAAANSPTARVPLLYPFAAEGLSVAPRWLIPGESDSAKLIEEMRVLRSDTSKKDASVRLRELARAASSTGDHLLLTAIATRADVLTQSSFGCQFISEILLSSAIDGDKTVALHAVAALAAGNPLPDDEDTPGSAKKAQAEEAEMKADGEGRVQHISKSPHAGRMLKSLAAGARYDPVSKGMIALDPPLGFSSTLAKIIGEFVVEWALSESSFVVANMLADTSMQQTPQRDSIVKKLVLRKRELKQAAAGGVAGASENDKGKPGGNKGAAAVLQHL